MSNPFDDIDEEVAIAGGMVEVDEVLGDEGLGDAGEHPTPYQDDWQHQLSQIDAARAQHPHSDVDQAIAARELQRQENDQQAVQVRTSPPSAYRGIFGAQTVVTSGNVSDWIVWWTGDDIESRDVTITICNLGNTGGLNWPLASNSGNIYSYRPYAKIRWGTRAFMTTATVDVGRGSQLVVSGSAVYVQLGLDPAQAGYVAGTMSLAAMMSFGARQSMQPIIRSEYIDSLGNGATANIVIPDFAQQLITVQRSQFAGSAPAFTLTFKDTNGLALYAITVLADGTGLTAPIPLSSDTYSVDVTNNGAGGSANFRLAFGLCL